MTGLPPIDQSLLPAEVREGSKQDKQDYEAALSFERMLLGQLTKALTETAKPDGESEQDAASSMYMQMLPDKLADSLISSGGLGLAHDYYASVKEQS